MAVYTRIKIGPFTFVSRPKSLNGRIGQKPMSFASKVALIIVITLFWGTALLMLLTGLVAK
jgi:hypothetical protein